MPIILDANTGTFERAMSDAPPEWASLPDGSQPNSRIGGWCAFCEFPFDGTNFELRTIGTHGAICDSCVQMVATTCDGCSEDGIAEFDWRMRGQLAFGLRGRMESHMQHRHHERWWNDEDFRMRSRNVFHTWAARMASWDPVISHRFWGLSGDEPTLTRTHNNALMCEECVGWCERCSDPFDAEDLFSFEGMVVCNACGTPACEECGERWEFEEEARRCCMRSLHDYSFRPQFRFWHIADGELSDSWRPTNELFLGVELETECGLDSFADFLSDACEDGNNPEFIYGKRDGSLDDSGIELVTMPATMDAFMRRFPFDALQRWNERGARSFYRDACGLHIHVSRSHFTPTHMWRFVAWQMRNQWFCERIAQRNSSQWARWQTLGEFGTEWKPSLADAVKGKGTDGERYVAINFQNKETVELRYFRGNLRPDAIRMRVEFVDALARFTRNMSARDVMEGALSVSHFVRFVFAHHARYGTLASWMMDNENDWEDA